MEPQWGIIFNIWSDEPVYHRRDQRVAAGRDLSIMTICGRTVGINKPLIPFKHCKKIGRPCKGCFGA